MWSATRAKAKLLDVFRDSSDPPAGTRIPELESDVGSGDARVESRSDGAEGDGVRVSLGLLDCQVSSFLAEVCFR